MLDEEEFLSPYGIRSLSRRHRDAPVSARARRPAAQRSTTSRRESDRGLFGGNSNWRGPVWLPMNYLVIEALQRLTHYYGDDRSRWSARGLGKAMNLLEVAASVAPAHRLFTADARRPPPGDRRHRVQPTRTGATTSPSTSTSTATPAKASAPRPDRVDGLVAMLLDLGAALAATGAQSAAGGVKNLTMGD